MAKNNATLSSTGFTLPYKRYLGDAAGGVVFAAVVVGLLGYRLNVDDVDTPVVLAALGFLLVLAPAVGLVYNATSWFVLGGLQLRLEHWLAAGSAQSGLSNWRPGTAATVRTSRFVDLVEHHRIPLDRDGWFRETGRIQAELRARHPEVMERLDYVEGGRSLARNLSLSFLVALVGNITIHRTSSALLSTSNLTLAFLFLITMYVAGLIGFYYETEILDRWDVRHESPQQPNA